MAQNTPSPALNPLWKEMSLPHYLKELRSYLQEGWQKDPGTPEPEIAEFEKRRKALEKKGAAANISDAKKFLRDSVGIIIRRLQGEVSALSTSSTSGVTTSGVVVKILWGWVGSL